jgi:hypothetical protein
MFVHFIGILLVMNHEVLKHHQIHYLILPQVAPPGPGELRIRITAVAPSPLDVAGQKVPSDAAMRRAFGREKMLGNHVFFFHLRVKGILFLTEPWVL